MEKERLEKNKYGGIEDHSLDALKRAKEYDLITFPSGIVGTNCFNCEWISNKQKDIGYCTNKHLKQHVSGHMCCNLWNRKDALRAFK